MLVVPQLHKDKAARRPSYLAYLAATLRRRVERLIEGELAKHNYLLAGETDECPHMRCIETLLSLLAHPLREARAQTRDLEMAAQMAESTLGAVKHFRLHFHDEYICAALNSSALLATQLEEAYAELLALMGVMAGNVCYDTRNDCL